MPADICSVLTALSQRQKSGTVHGELRADGRDLSPAFRRKIGFCTQSDIHDDTSTIREAFLFSARLRQDQAVPDAEKVKYADSVVDLLGLREYADALIGSLSLELKRKTSIGVELCAKPTLLMFLDEPTSVRATIQNCRICIELILSRAWTARVL